MSAVDPRQPPTPDDPEPIVEPAVAAEPAPEPAAVALDLDAVTADLAAVEAALDRLDQGSYGRCGACSSAIDDERLAADPTATTCAAHLPV